MSGKYKVNEKTKVYFIGAGIASMSGALFLTRDARVKGKDITIFEQLNIDGGSCDGSGDAENGYMIRGGRMINYEHYTAILDMLNSVPSLTDPQTTVRDEIYKFSNETKTCAHARLIGKDHNILDASSLGFNNNDRAAMVKLMLADEDELAPVRIDQLFSPHFFETNFWYMWATTFAFQPWHSAFEFKRYAHAFVNEMPRLNTLGGVHRTPYNQYDSIILPMQKHLKNLGVKFQNSTKVVNIDFKEEDGEMIAKAIHIFRNNNEEVIQINENDLVFITNGTMTENSTIGAMNRPASTPTKEGNGCWALWEKLANITPEFGNPAPFCNNISESVWQSFTVTLKDKKFLKKYVEYSSNKPGTGALMTFKDSGWFMSIVVPKQPHFINQPEDVEVFWGYALHPEKLGDYIKKPMFECTGEEIFKELCYQLGWIDEADEFIKTTICLPCIMPYITAHFMTRNKTDRPLVIPKCSTNLAFIGQYVELPDVVSFTIEMSVRTAQEAVYTFYDLHDTKLIPPFYKGETDIRVLLGAAAAMMN